ncbi:C80 family cysteine peptidase, partial [Yersinia sp. Marseille-Q3913]|uniref:C80 family cysteine peptidase n=1 Tax=Yersinia sp. Marseille-Q3913 TaxID=2830769 RepID=UPI001BB061F2
MPNGKPAKVITLDDGILSEVRKVATGLYESSIAEGRVVKIGLLDMAGMNKRKKKVLFSQLNQFLTKYFKAETIPSSIMVDNNTIMSDGRVIAEKRDGVWIGEKFFIDSFERQRFYDHYKKDSISIQEGVTTNGKYGIKFTGLKFESPDSVCLSTTERSIIIDLQSYIGSNLEKYTLIQKHINMIKDDIDSYFTLEDIPEKMVIINNPSNANTPHIVSENRDFHFRNVSGGGSYLEKIDFAVHEQCLNKEYKRLKGIFKKNSNIKDEINDIKKAIKIISKYNSIEGLPTNPTGYIIELLSDASLKNSRSKLIKEMLSDAGFIQYKIVAMGSVPDGYLLDDTLDFYKPSKKIGTSELVDKLFKSENNIKFLRQIFEKVKKDKNSLNYLIKRHSDLLAPFFSNKDGSIDSLMLLKTATDTDAFKLLEKYIKINSFELDLTKRGNWVDNIFYGKDKYKAEMFFNTKNQFPEHFLIEDWHSHELEEIIKIDKPSNYDFQVIFQLENSEDITKSATRLAGKHLGKSVIIQLDLDGQYSMFSFNSEMNDITPLSEANFIDKFKSKYESGKIRWQVVGHGNGDIYNPSTTLSDQKPTKLADTLYNFCNKLQQQHQININPRHITLAGCALATKNIPDSYAFQFISSIGDRGVKASVSAMRDRACININGRKYIYPKAYFKVTDYFANNNNNNNKTVLYWNQSGGISMKYKNKDLFSSDVDPIYLQKDVGSPSKTPLSAPNKLAKISPSDSNLSKPQPESSPSITK